MSRGIANQSICLSVVFSFDISADNVCPGNKSLTSPIEIDDINVDDKAFSLLLHISLGHISKMMVKTDAMNR